MKFEDQWVYDDPPGNPLEFGSDFANAVAQNVDNWRNAIISTLQYNKKYSFQAVALAAEGYHTDASSVPFSKFTLATPFTFALS